MKQYNIKTLLSLIAAGNVSQEEFVTILGNLGAIYLAAKREGGESLKSLRKLIETRPMTVEGYNDIMNSPVEEFKAIALDRFEEQSKPHKMEVLKGKLAFYSHAGLVNELKLNQGALLVENNPILNVNPKLYYRVSDIPLAIAMAQLGKDKAYGKWTEDGFELDEKIFGVHNVAPNGSDVFKQKVKNTRNALRGKIVFSEDFSGGIRMDAAVLGLTDVISIKTTDSMEKMKAAMLAAGVAATIVSGVGQQAHAMDVIAAKSVQEVTQKHSGQFDFLVDSATGEIRHTLGGVRSKIGDLQRNGQINDLQANNMFSRIEQIEEKLAAINSPDGKESFKKMQSNFKMVDTWAENFVKDPLKAVKGKISQSDYNELEYKMKSVGSTSSDVAGSMKARSTNIVTY